MRLDCFHLWNCLQVVSIMSFWYHINQKHFSGLSHQLYYSNMAWSSLVCPQDFLIIIYPRKYTQIFTTWFMHAYIGHIFLVGISHSTTSTWFFISGNYLPDQLFWNLSCELITYMSCNIMFFFVSLLVTWTELFVFIATRTFSNFLWNDIKYNASLGVGILMSEKKLPLFSIQIDFHFHLGSILFGAYMKGFQY